MKFKGRINRTTYIVGQSILNMYGICVAILVFFILRPSPSEQLYVLMLILVSWIPILPFYLCMQAKRNHDLGWTDEGNKKLRLWQHRMAWIYNSGDKRKNKYGPAPHPGIDWKALNPFTA